MSEHFHQGEVCYDEHLDDHCCGELCCTDDAELCPSGAHQVDGEDEFVSDGDAPAMPGVR